MSARIEESVESILLFWFGDSLIAEQVSQQQGSLWWSKNEKVDKQITQRFAVLVDEVAEAKFLSWNETPSGLLASIICLDQFPRNMYRGKAQSFAYDHLALEYANLLISKGFDQELPQIYRVFGYLPFEHSENLANQERSVELYLQLLSDAESNDKKIFEGYYEFALKHHQFIEKFGRFPHRNSLLGRESTELEVEFLSQPGSSF